MEAILWSTLVAGTLDISAAILLRAMVNGIAATRVLQSVASGVLGRDAFAGDLRIAALGLLLHFLMMAVIATVFYLVSRRLPMLATDWVGFGLAYGVIVYLIMSFVVVPSVAAFVEGVIVHMICVGLPIACITSRWPSPG